MIRTRFAAVAAASMLAAATIAGCGSDAGRTAPSTQQGVSDVLSEQMQNNEQEAPQGESPTAGGGQASTENGGSAFVGDNGPAFEQVDYDLAAMNPDMVYATVYDMMVNPAQYEGKVVKMEGPYYHAFYEATGKDYFYVIIRDATACCSQGFEFVWGDGSHAYPKDYPGDGTEVVVCGRFEPYSEGTMNYIHLVDASLQAAKAQ